MQSEHGGKVCGTEVDYVLFLVENQGFRRDIQIIYVTSWETRFKIFIGLTSQEESANQKPAE